jgi:hypothetical protein
MNPKIIALAVAFALVCINSLGGSPGAQMPRLAQAVPSTQPLPLPPPQPGGTGFGQDVIPGQGDPHKPGFDPKAVPFHDFHPEFSPGPGSRQAVT